MSFWSRLFAKGEQVKKIAEVKKANVEFGQLNYHPKILAAWIKCLEGEANFGKYLNDNGFEELFHTQQALILNPISRNWLMNNGFPHLMAFVSAAEGDENAKAWLKNFNFYTLHAMAIAIDDEEEGFKELKAQGNQLIFELAGVIKKIKDGIEFRHNDVYSFGKDQ